MQPEQVVSGHIPPLDGLRAFAILLVVLVHGGLYYIMNQTPNVSLWNDIVVNGRSGVDLFFVLSGFLITGILLDTRERSDYFPRFYWRRTLRIWPLYYAFLFAALIIHPRPFSQLGFRPFALYYRNFLGPDRASDVYFGQYWSLCIEEQFYLVWPIVIYFLPRLLRLPLAVAMMAAALLIRIHLLHQGLSLYVVYRLPWCRMDSLAAGAAIAMLLRQGVARAVLRRVFWAAIGAAILAQLYVGRVGWPNNGYRFTTVGITAYALFFGGVVGLAVTAVRRTPVTAFLGSRALRAIATRSYAMYLFHLVPLYISVVLLHRITDFPQQKWTGIGAIVVVAAAAYGMAWISWKYFEEPILRLKGWEWYRRKRPEPATDTTRAA